MEVGSHCLPCLQGTDKPRSNCRMQECSSANQPATNSVAALHQYSATCGLDFLQTDDLTTLSMRPLWGIHTTLFMSPYL